MIRRVGWLFLISTVGACSDGEGRYPGLDATAVLPGDIQVLPGSTGFFGVRDLAVQAGSIWVLDSDPPFVTRIPLEGGPAHSFGDRGGGPREFQDPWAIGEAESEPGSSIAVWDLGGRKVSYWAESGAFLRSEVIAQEGTILARADIREVSYVDPLRVRTIGGKALVGNFPRRVHREGDVTSGSLRLGTPTLFPERTVVEFRDHVNPNGPLNRVWTAAPLWDACPGSIAVWSPGRGSVVWYDTDGSELFSSSLTLAEIEITEEDILAYLKRIARLELGPGASVPASILRQFVNRAGTLFAETHPGPVDLRCESDGVAWLRLFGTLTNPIGKGRFWLRVAKGGETEAFELPTQFEPFRFLPGTVYGAVSDATGLQRLAVWGHGIT